MFNTQLKQGLTSLKERLSSMEQVRDSLDSEMLVLDLDAMGRITYVNQNFEREMVYSRNELVNRKLVDLKRV